ncbi:MAG: AmmeMemoRadiSam system radical SAM enzyme [Candidatus Marsarchaeota archaeon]|nr:AmmeMemoRadiSam system radical SAM enzyme [Candidatus Marsarchaeota archaeon]MCL5413389.1 AmmeMemoRadiSam system radical SAM enzyme [Candidatus Marsarchaeota archaeon]
MIKKAILGRTLGDGKVECYACARRCKIPQGSHGFCFVRQNIGGELALVNYGVLSAIQIDPIEKKPFNHFMPGTYVLGIGTSSCNWGCQFCQNHNISRAKEIDGCYVSPEDIVRRAIECDVKGIAFTYNEPAIFVEYALDVARVAHKEGLFTMFITNGYMTTDAVQEMRGLIDAAVVNFKGNGDEKFSNKFEAVTSNEPIKEALLEMKRSGMHIEITDLIIPQVGESLRACDSLTKWIADNIGAYTPIHFTQFHPDYRMLNYPQTAYKTLKLHYDIARKNGLRYVYIGNVAGNPHENTYCHSCGAIAIKRDGVYLSAWNLGVDDRCKKCNSKIPISGCRETNIIFKDITSVY